VHQLVRLTRAAALAPRRLLETPALVVRGASDPVVPQRWAERAARLAHAELVVVDGAGHGAPFAQPEQVARAITAFARRVDH
jgi:pimeloyl-ACP methyl ester carboxylesterase